MTSEKDKDMHWEYIQGQLWGLAHVCGLILIRLGDKDTDDALTNLVKFAGRAEEGFHEMGSNAEDVLKRWQFAQGLRQVVGDVEAQVAGRIPGTRKYDPPSPRP